jgi:signal transduction histidine kinase
MMPSSEARYRILVADDESQIRHAYAIILGSDPQRTGLDAGLGALSADLFGSEPDSSSRQVQFDVTIVRQGAEAIAAVTKACADGYPFSVAFIDVRMPPGIDGVATAAAIRRIDSEINIVVVTGYSDYDTHSIVGRVPPIDKVYYLQKPPQVGEITQFAAALSGKWRMQRELQAALLDTKLRCVELTRLAADLEQSKLDAETAARAKSDFLARMSHELRTPFNAIIGFSEMMTTEIRGPLGHPSYNNYLATIETSSKHLLQFINDILDLSRVEAGRLRLEEVVADFGAIVETTIEMTRTQSEAAAVSVSVVCDGELPFIRADVRLILQVLLNLLSNAIKFTPAGGRIAVDARPARDGSISCSVTGTGIGIAPEHISKALEPFGQIESQYSRNFKGTGLGLPIAKSLIELHGGELTLESMVGSGTKVTFTLPAERITRRTGDDRQARNAPAA